jgi:hypothetical protein
MSTVVIPDPGSRLGQALIRHPGLFVDYRFRGNDRVEQEIQCRHYENDSADSGCCRSNKTAAI